MVSCDEVWEHTSEGILISYINKKIVNRGEIIQNFRYCLSFIYSCRKIIQALWRGKEGGELWNSYTLWIDSCKIALWIRHSNLRGFLSLEDRLLTQNGVWWTQILFLYRILWEITSIVDTMIDTFGIIVIANLNLVSLF